MLVGAELFVVPGGPRRGNRRGCWRERAGREQSAYAPAPAAALERRSNAVVGRRLARP